MALALKGVSKRERERIFGMNLTECVGNFGVRVQTRVEDVGIEGVVGTYGVPG